MSAMTSLDSSVPTSTAGPFQEGTLIDDRFELGKKIGEGGMGYVYSARQVKINREVVIKLLKPQLCASEEQVSRFKREAELASKLSHPNCVVIYDFGFHSGVPYIAMEYLEGCSLGDVLYRRGPLPLVEAVHIVSQVCDALEASQALGVVHRDLKPENIFMLSEAQGSVTVKVLDFGIAKLAHNHPEASDSNLTRGDMIFGTPQYMAPEQIRGRPLDHRADLYSLTVIFFELISGSLPYDSEDQTDIVSVLTQHLRDPIPELSADDLKESTRSHIGEINRVISRGMAKDPNERYQSPTALFAEIKELGEGQGQDRSIQHQGMPTPTADRLVTRPSLLFSSLGDLTHEEMSHLTSEQLLNGDTLQTTHEQQEPAFDLDHKTSSVSGRREPLISGGEGYSSASSESAISSSDVTPVRKPSRIGRTLVLMILLVFILVMAVTHPASHLSDSRWLDLLPEGVSKPLKSFHDKLRTWTSPYYRELPESLLFGVELGSLDEAKPATQQEGVASTVGVPSDQREVTMGGDIQPEVPRVSSVTIEDKADQKEKSGKQTQSIGVICVRCSADCDVEIGSKQFKLKANPQARCSGSSGQFKKIGATVGEHRVLCRKDRRVINQMIEVSRMKQHFVNCDFR